MPRQTRSTNSMSRKLLAYVAAGTAVAACATACTGAGATSKELPSARNTNSATPASAPASLAGGLVQPAPGKVVYAQSGIGPAVIAPGSFAPNGHHVTIKLACQGSGSGESLPMPPPTLNSMFLAVSGWESSTRVDMPDSNADKTLHLEVGKDVKWEFWSLALRKILRHCSSTIFFASNQIQEQAPGNHGTFLVGPLATCLLGDPTVKRRRVSEACALAAPGSSGCIGVRTRPSETASNRILAAPRTQWPTPWSPRPGRSSAEGCRMATLVAVNVGMPEDVAWHGTTVRTGIWKRPVAGPVTARFTPAYRRVLHPALPLGVAVGAVRSVGCFWRPRYGRRYRSFSELAGLSGAGGGPLVSWSAARDSGAHRLLGAADSGGRWFVEQGGGGVDEFLDEGGGSPAGPGHGDLVGAEVFDRDRLDARPGVEVRGGRRDHRDPLSAGDEFELLLDAVDRRYRAALAGCVVPLRCPRHSGTASGSWRRWSAARSATWMDCLPARRCAEATTATRGSVNSGLISRPAGSIGSRTMPTSARPSCSTSAWSCQPVRSIRTSSPGWWRSAQHAHDGGERDPRHERDREAGDALACGARTRRSSASALASRGLASWTKLLAGRCGAPCDGGRVQGTVPRAEFAFEHPAAGSDG